MKKILQIVLVLCVFSVSSVLAQTDIRNFDFNNFTYEPACGSAAPETVKVVNGVFFEEKKITVVPDKKRKSDPTYYYERKYFKPYQTVFGDLNGDETDEAIVLTTCGTGGIESFTEAFVFGIKDSEVALLTRIDGGDRASGGIRKIAVESGMIKVDRSRPGADACCAEFAETTIYRFQNGALVQIGDKMTEPIYPPTRIQFSEGTSKAMLDLKLPKRGEFKRFILFGQKGQTLYVSTTSPDAVLRMFAGNAQVNLNPKPIKKTSDYKATNVLEADLKETGDFVFEVGNLALENVDLNVTINIEVR